MHLVLVTPAFIPTVIAATSASPLVIAAPLQTLIVGLVIPIVVGLITKATLSAGVKAIIMIVLDGANALLAVSQLPDGSASVGRIAFYTAVTGIITSAATYLGVYRPLKLTSSTSDGRLGPNFGIGKAA